MSDPLTNTPAEAQTAIPRRKPSSAFTLEIKDVVTLLVTRWYWFIISLALCVGLALFMLARTQNTYKATATVLILDDDEKNAGAIDLETLGIKEVSANILNEIARLRSPYVMTDVVERLGLNSRYFTKNGLRLDELYTSSPVIVTPADTLGAVSYRFSIKLDGNKNFVLSGFSGTAGGSDTQVKGSLGQTVKTPVGTFTISPSPAYAKSPYKSAEILYTYMPAADLAQGFAGKVSASVEQPRSSIVNIEVIDACRDRSVDILNALIEAYEDSYKREQSMAAVSTTDFINRRLAIIEEDLGSVENDISNFKASTQTPDVMSASQAYFGRTFQNQTLILDLHSELSMAQMVRRELGAEGISTTLPVNAVLQQSGINQQISEYNRLVIERNRLIANSSESSPLVAEISATLHTLKDNMERSLDNYIRSITQQLANLNASDSRASGELAANPGREKYLLSVERQQKVKENLYLYLLQKREESELSQAYTRSRIAIVSAPAAGGAPIAPRRASILLIAVAVGLVAPVLIYFLRETLNTEVRGRRDLANLSAPFVGEIPYGPGKRTTLPAKLLPRKIHSATRHDLVVKEGSNNVINEAFRAIRTSLEFMTPDNQGEGRLITFTSACSGSGKTFVVMNLAKALSLSGKRVCVVDLDLRKASLSHWGRHTDRGITNLLIGQCEVPEIVVKDIDNNTGIDLIPVGTLPPNPVELLSHKRLKEVLGSLSGQYDYVLIDCPPAEIVSDARIVSRITDMTIFIIRAGMFEKSMLEDLDAYAKSGRYGNLAVVLNGTDPNSLYSRKRYGYGYGYGYGYINK